MTTPTFEQPMPVPNDRPSIQSMVRADIDAREQVGIQRYGTALQAHNGRDALRDAYEEAMDLTIYLRQVIEERGPLAAEARGYARAIAVLRDDARFERWWSTLPADDPANAYWERRGRNQLADYLEEIARDLPQLEKSYVDGEA